MALAVGFQIRLLGAVEINTPDLAHRLARALDIPHADAQRVTRTFFSAIASECISFPRLELRGFGTFSAVRRRPRPARNFQTGARIVVPDRLAMKFKASPAVVSKLNTTSAGRTSNPREK